MEGKGRVGEYAGGYSDWLRQRPQQPPSPVLTPTRPAKPPALPRPAAFPAKLQRELDRIPEYMAAIETDIARRELLLDDQGLYARDPQGFARITDELAALRADLAVLEERWLELEGLREAQAG
jgi:ATP-binding cassette subfamily F protein uup